MAISIKALWTRRAFAICCSVLTVLFTVLAVVGWFEPRHSFTFSLVFSFFAWLFLFHAIFGFANLLTTAQARAIDYLYLGVAALGVFVLAFNYQGKRDEYDFSERTQKLSDALSNASSETGIIMSRIDTATCGVGSSGKPFPAHCELVEMTDEYALDKENMRDKKKITVEEFLERLPPAPPGQEEGFARVQKNIPLLTSARAKMITAAGTLEEHKARAKTHDVLDESHGLFTWPFILAFAFALRLTRTTIEVFDWTRRLSPVATS